MEAKDTVIKSFKDIPFTPALKAGWDTWFREVAKAQAEISFEAGIKKMIKWVDENSYETADSCDLSGDLILGIEEKDWEALKKEMEDVR